MTRGDSSRWSDGVSLDQDFLSGLIAAASDLALVLEGDGTIRQVLVGAQETGFGNLAHWQGRPVFEFLTRESTPKLQSVLEEFRDGQVSTKAVELNHTDNAVWEFPVRYTFQAMPDRRLLIMLGRDLRPIAETQKQLVQAQMSLEQGYEARREFDSRYRLLLRTVRDAIVFVSVADGRIKDLNDPAASLLGSTREGLVGASFAQEFRDRRREEFIEGLLNTAISEDSAGFEVTARRNRTAMAITPSVFRAAGERVLICRLESDEDTARRQDDLSLNLGGLYDRGADAMVFTTAAGVIQNCNDAFLDMVDAAHLVDVKGRSLGDFLGRGQIDMSVLVENARRAGQMKLYSTKILNEYGAKTAAELSVTWLNDRAEPELGFVIRDASRVEMIRTPAVQGSEDNARNVMELVGSATLKEIVSETTDVVEKMCIETAVNLTRNNRVAAAEMLGLSRQSLYVKLRKYGLLHKDYETDG